MVHFNHVIWYHVYFLARVLKIVIIQLNYRARAPQSQSKINRRYISSLPITKAKYMDLKKLCDTGVIIIIINLTSTPQPRDQHNFSSSSFKLLFMFKISYWQSFYENILVNGSINESVLWINSFKVRIYD